MALTGPSSPAQGEAGPARASSAKVQPLHAQRASVVPPPPVDPDGRVSWLREWVAVVGGDRWLVAGIAGAVLAAGLAYVWLATPVYRADLLVQVEEKKKGGALGELSTFFSESSPAETEVEILRSRTLVGSVVDALKLDLDATPRRFPLIGAALARGHAGDQPAGALAGFRRYGWGGERIALSRLELGKSWRGAPPVLVAREGGRFDLRGPGGGTLASGGVGELVRAGGLELYVSDLSARPGTEFLLRRTPREKAVAALQREVRIVERGKKTGILQLSLDGPDPARITAILDALAQAYVRQNMDRRSAEAEQTLAFLDTQLPALRSEVEAAETRLEEFRKKGGGVDVTLETQAAVARSADVEKSIAETRLEIGALLQRFTDAHPTVQAARARLARLEADRGGVDARLHKLPEAELESARLLRDVKVATELYVGLLDKAQELRVVKSGVLANVRIVDPAAATDEPVSPRRFTTLLLALVLGLGLGVATALGRRALDRGVDDPEELERVTGVSVHATIPQSDRQRSAQQAKMLLASHAPEDVAVESIRSLRTALKFSLLDAAGRVVAITGPAPEVGKSFVTANLALVIAESGKRVLVVDADLRRGHLHAVFGAGRAPGLSEVLVGDAAWTDVVRREVRPGVDLLAGGRHPPNPSVLFESERFAKLVQELGEAYDLVLVDTPPILAVTDTVLAAARANAVLCVLRAGRHPMREVLATQRRLAHGGVRIDGFVLNGVDLRRSVGAVGYHYQYTYDREG